MSTIITEYEIDCIGIDHPQYFPGRSAIHTVFDTVYVGCGNNPMEAFDEAVGEAVEDGWDTDIIIENERALFVYGSLGNSTMPNGPWTFTSHFNEQDLHSSECPIFTASDREIECTCELMYYIAIYVK